MPKRDRAGATLLVGEKMTFLQGEVFFLLTSPLMGDPFFSKEKLNAVGPIEKGRSGFPVNVKRWVRILCGSGFI